LRQDGRGACPVRRVDWLRNNLSTYGERRSTFTSGVYPRWFRHFLSRQADGSRLQYLRNRYYNPNTGRFTQEDPIGLAGGLNLYGFANGDPVNFSDPFGLCPIPPTNCLDIAFLAWDVGDFARNPSLGTAGGVLLGAAALLPGIPNVNAIRRGGRAAGAAAGAASRIERHHQLPRAFRQQFERAGLDIERFTVDLPADAHRFKPGGLHTGPDNWNNQWKQFFRQTENPTQQQILDQLGRMRREFGLDDRRP
jgi:RHS repeat-associated protein